MIHLRKTLMFAPLLVLAACDEPSADATEADEKSQKSVPSLGPQLASGLPMPMAVPATSIALEAPLGRVLDQGSDPSEADVAELTALLVPEFGQRQELASPYDQPASFRVADYDLDEDGTPEMLVRFEGGGKCGSGGCVFRVYRRSAHGLEKVSGTTLSFLPVSISDHSTNGWRDIILCVRRDYVASGRVRLRYGGESYPLNPTVPPSEPTELDGAVVLDEDSPLHLLPL